MKEDLPILFYTTLKFHNGNKKLSKYVEKVFTKSKEETFLVAEELVKNIFEVDLTDEESWNETLGSGVWNIASSYITTDSDDVILEITTENSVPHQLLLKLSENIKKVSKKSYLTGIYLNPDGLSGAFRYVDKEHSIEEFNHTAGDDDIMIDLETLRERLEVEHI